jgi:hypothetical protein
VLPLPVACWLQSTVLKSLKRTCHVVRITYCCVPCSMWHQLGQAVFFFALGGLPWLVWGFVIRVLGEAGWGIGT